jgi:hypothetical protein
MKDFADAAIWIYHSLSIKNYSAEQSLPVA